MATKNKRIIQLPVTKPKYSNAQYDGLVQLQCLFLGLPRHFIGGRACR